MDWDGMKHRAYALLKKYRYVALILAAGLILMALPEEKEVEKLPQEQTQQQPSLETRLEEILSRVSGAGKVKVLLTQARGEELLYQTDTDESRTDTVILTGTDREETGLVRQIIGPEYLGAVVVCQGGDSPAVKLAIVEAVMDVTGLSSHQITVLKMK